MSAEVVTTPYVIDEGKITDCCSAACAARSREQFFT